MDNQMSRKQRAISLVAFTAIWLFVVFGPVLHRRGDRVFDSLLILPVLLASFFPWEGRWRWFLYGVTAGMFSGALILHFFPS
jgi:hypothetical protein